MSTTDTNTRADLYWIARGTTITAIRAALNDTAAEIRAVWDYRAAGLTVDQARAEMSAHTPSHSYRQRRAARGQWAPRQDRGRIWHMMLRRREERTQHAQRIAAAVSPADWLAWRPAWKDCCRSLVLPGGMLLRTVREESCQWSRGSKRHWPTSRSTSYRTTLHRGDCGEIAAQVQHDGRGDWRARVMAELHLAEPLRDATLSMRLHPCCRLSRAHALCDGITVAARTLAGAPVDAVAWHTDGTTYHADDVRAAVAGLERKRALAAGRTTGDTLSVEIAHERWGFCRRGLAEFAAAVGLDASVEYARTEIAAALNHDARKTYANELRTAGLL